MILLILSASFILLKAVIFVMPLSVSLFSLHRPEPDKPDGIPTELSQRTAALALFV
jgi:hypothetical protein